MGKYIPINKHLILGLAKAEVMLKLAAGDIPDSIATEVRDRLAEYKLPSDSRLLTLESDQRMAGEPRWRLVANADIAELVFSAEIQDTEMLTPTEFSQVAPSWFYDSAIAAGMMPDRRCYVRSVTIKVVGYDMERAESKSWWYVYPE